jgi:hypothetical protein
MLRLTFCQARRGLPHLHLVGIAGPCITGPCASWWLGLQAPARRQWRERSPWRSHCLASSSTARIGAPICRRCRRPTQTNLFARVTEAITANAWISDGHYGLVRDLIWRRATHLIWFDYGHGLIMYRAIRRSMARALDQSELWPRHRQSAGLALLAATEPPYQMGMADVAGTAGPIRGASEPAAIRSSGDAAAACVTRPDGCPRRA